MGHYASELFPRGYEVHMREERESRIAQQKKEADKRETERQNARRVYESVKDLPYEKLSQEDLKPEVEKMINRVERISDMLPKLQRIDILDSLNRSWEADWNKGKDKRIYLLGMRRSYEGTREAHLISLIRHNRVKDAGVSYVNWSMSDPMQHDNLWALVPTKERFNDLFSGIEKALGLTEV